jgi:hypothetical protein
MSKYGAECTSTLEKIFKIIFDNSCRLITCLVISSQFRSIIGQFHQFQAKRWNWCISKLKNRNEKNIYIYTKIERQSARKKGGGLDIVYVIHSGGKQLNKIIFKYVSVNILPSVDADRRMFCSFIWFFSF